MPQENICVLVMGHRRGLTKALESRGINYWLWSSKAVKNKIKAEKQIISDFTQKSDLIDKLLEGKNFDFVIAGTEEAVMPAAVIRGKLNTKRNPKSILLRCTDKFEMKRFLAGKNIPMTQFASARESKDPNSYLEKLSFPIISKDRNNSGGRGLQKLNSIEELMPLLGTSTIFENCIEGSEGSVESLVYRGKPVFTNITEYQKIGKCNLVPAHYNSEIEEEILKLNQKVISVLNIKWGITHLEFYKTKDDLLFGELAMRPPGGYIMECLKLAYGKNFWDLLLDIELQTFQKSPIPLKGYSAAQIIHPGKGKVQAILGEAEALKIPSLKKLSIKVKAGDEIAGRIGVGEDCAYALFLADSKERLREDIALFDEVFKVEISS